MFTWICPQCGREVPPSYSECPTCAERAQAGGAQPARPPVAAPPPPPQAPQHQAPPPAYQPPPPQYAPPAPPPPPAYQPPHAPQYQAPPPAYQPPPPPPQYEQPPAYQPPPQAPPPVYTLGDEGKKGMPSWLVAFLTIALLGGALFGLYKLIGGKNGAADKAGKTVEQAPVAGHPYLRYLEVAGFRIFENAQKKVMIRYAVINHGAADLSGVELRITFTSSKAAPGDPPVAVVNAKVGNVEPYGSKEIESPLDTKQRYYELPDWQFLRASVEVTAPK